MGQEGGGKRNYITIIVKKKRIYEKNRIMSARSVFQI